MIVTYPVTVIGNHTDFLLNSRSLSSRSASSSSDSSSVPAASASTADNGQEADENNSTEILISATTLANSTKLIDPSVFIRVKENDWRDAHEERMIIWSIESRWHPEFGKNFAKGEIDTQRLTRSSKMMSFMILGSVIGFILYTYLGHVLMMRRIDREERASRMREIIRRSAFLMVPSDGEDENERRRSLINMFKGFKL